MLQYIRQLFTPKAEPTTGDYLDNIDIYLLNDKIVYRVRDGKEGRGRVVQGGQEVLTTISPYWMHYGPDWLIGRLEFNGRLAVGFKAR